MSENRDRAESKMADQRIVETAKALIEIYKSAFAEDWESVYRETVRLNLG